LEVTDGIEKWGDISCLRFYRTGIWALVEISIRLTVKELLLISKEWIDATWHLSGIG